MTMDDFQIDEIRQDVTESLKSVYVFVGILDGDYVCQRLPNNVCVVSVIPVCI